MRIFFDTEFMENGSTIELLSLGAVREDGEEFYAINSKADYEHANPWVREHVIPLLGRVYDPPVGQLRFHHTNPGAIAQLFYEFVGPTPYPQLEFWSYYASYDWVALCQLYGQMVHLPTQWPKFPYDLRQWLNHRGQATVYQSDDHPHHALADARWIAETWKTHVHTMMKAQP